jgi:hypothetical protein
MLCVGYTGHTFYAISQLSYGCVTHAICGSLPQSQPRAEIPCINTYNNSTKHLPATIHNHFIVHQLIITSHFLSYPLVAQRCAQLNLVTRKEAGTAPVRRILQGLLSPRRMPNPTPPPSYTLHALQAKWEGSHGVIQP